jgi:cytoskeletal protein CcmA (bactofilin family)
MNNPNDMSKENSIFIGEGVVFKGSIKAPNQAVISGQFDGELEARDVLIGASGVVTGKTTAQFVDVKGELNETVISRELLIVRGTGRVRGSVTYGEIEIERGGQVKGDMIQR